MSLKSVNKAYLAKASGELLRGVVGRETLTDLVDIDILFNAFGY